jgi:iron(III) transport system permease protein
MSTLAATRLWNPDSGGAVQAVARGALFLILLALIGGPLLVLLLSSLTPPGTPPLTWAGLTLTNFSDALGQPGTLRVILNTLTYACGSVVLGVGIALVLAFLTERTDLPGRTTARILMFSWMAVPPLVFGFGWILLLNPGNGVLNAVLRTLLGLDGAPLTPYSMTALIVITGLNLVPTCYVMLSGLLRNMDPTLEDAAHVSGAGMPTVLRRITAPLLTPGILSVGIFLVMAMVQAFDFPLIIGMTARVPVLSTRIYGAAAPDGGVPNYGLASAFGVMLLLLALLLLWVYFRSVRMSERFRVVSGKGFRPKKMVLRGGTRVVAAGSVILYFTLMLLPLLILLWASLFPFFRLPSWSQLPNMTLRAYTSIFSQPENLRLFFNTVLLFVSSSVAVMVVSCLVSWFSVRGSSRFGRVLDALSFAPMAIPPIVMAIALLLVFLRTPLNGTIWVIVAGHMAMFIAFGTRTMNAAFIQIHKDLENAALISGASWLASLRHVLLPIVWPHILNAWLWVVAQSARDLTFPLILLTASNAVASTAIFMRWDYPDLPGAAALAMLLVAAMMLIVVPAQIYLTRRAEQAG